MKGFATIIAVMAVFVLAVIMLSTAGTAPKNASFKENFSDTKAFIGNYEILLNQKMQESDWGQDPLVMISEIEGASTEILVEITPPQTTCYPIAVMPENNYFTFDFWCTTRVTIDAKVLFENTYHKKIYVKNYNSAPSAP